MARTPSTSEMAERTWGKELWGLQENVNVIEWSLAVVLMWSYYVRANKL